MGDHFFLELAGHVLVVAEFLAVQAPAAGEGAQVGGVVVQLHLRHLGPDDLERPLRVHAQDFAAATGEVAHDGPHEFLRHADLDLGDGLEHARLGRLERFAEGLLAGDLEGDVLGIHRVHFAVVKVDLHVHHAVAGEDAVGAGAVDSLFHGRHEHTIHVLADQGLGELHPVITWCGLEAHPHLGELAGAAALLFVPVLCRAVVPDGFAEGNLRGGQLHLNVEPFLDSLHGHLQMQFALAGNDRLV